MNLVNPDMSINLIQFKTKTGVWRVIGTESTGKGFENCIDEMKNVKTGEIVKRSRMQLMNLQNLDEIKPCNEPKDSVWYKDTIDEKKVPNKGLNKVGELF